MEDAKKEYYSKKSIEKISSISPTKERSLSNTTSLKQEAIDKLRRMKEADLKTKQLMAQTKTKQELK